ncbi:MAG TPA: hypothetical protein VF763_10955 [Candidatus Limnocylindrales bacterium]
MRPIRLPRLLGAVAPLVLLAACSSTGASPASTVAGVTAAPSMAASGSGGAVEINVSTKPGVGSFLTGADGRTLYVFAKDSPNTSVCSGQCATNWPPLEVPSGSQPMPGPGVTGTLATITRSDDGKLQVTYDGLPLYYFAKDAAAGDTNGQGIGGIWFVASPSGMPAASGAASPAASAGGAAPGASPTKGVTY